MQDEERKLVLGQVKESLRNEEAKGVAAALTELRESEISSSFGRISIRGPKV